MGKQLVNFKMDREEYAQIREKAEREGVNMSGLLRAYLRKWMDGGNSTLLSFIRWLYGQLPQDYWERLELSARRDTVSSRGQTKIALRFLLAFSEERQEMDAERTRTDEAPN